MIKNHLGQPVRKGCYSWNSCNDENNQLSTIREALYEAWKQGFREINFFSKIKSRSEANSDTSSY